MLNLSRSFFNNARKPRGIIGKLVIQSMNYLGHKALADWALPYIKIQDGESILDVGCGGGGNISRFLKIYPKSIVHGLDYSSVSVAVSKENNKKEIKDGRCHIINGNVKHLPYAKNTFNCITAFETVYYWPKIETSFQQILRVLKSDGKFIIINGADAEGGWTWDKFIDGMHTYTPAELKHHLIASGFKDIEIIRKKDFHFVCIIAYKKDF